MMLAILPPLTTALVLSALGVGLALRWLHAVQVLDLPNERSSHVLPTPRGGGLGVVPAIILTWAAFAGFFAWGLVLGAIALGALSWVDDIRGLSPLHRLLVQFLVCTAVVLDLHLPIWFLVPVAVLALVWFVNLYNFMDGIDGITGVESTAIAVGIAVVEGLTTQNQPMMAAALSIAGACLGFLIWNWHPAKIFMGDSGSVPLGLLLGGLLLHLALQGQWAAAIILPAYYGADATITLTRRLLAGEKVWQAHRKHFYQRATRGQANGPHNHTQVSLVIAIGDLALIAAAVLSVLAGPWVVVGLGLGAIVTCALLGFLSHWAKDAPL